MNMYNIYIHNMYNMYNLSKIIGHAKKQEKINQSKPTQNTQMLKLTDKSILKDILIVFHIFRKLRRGNILPKKKRLKSNF